MSEFCLTHKEQRKAAFQAATNTVCPYCCLELIEQQYNGLVLQLNEAVFRESFVKSQNAKLAQANRLLVEALENLMEWQVKNVKKWNNRAYDEAAAVLKEMEVGRG